MKMRQETVDLTKGSVAKGIVGFTIPLIRSRGRGKCGEINSHQCSVRDYCFGIDDDTGFVFRTTDSKTDAGTRECAGAFCSVF